METGAHQPARRVARKLAKSGLRQKAELLRRDPFQNPLRVGKLIGDL
jgi:hypothetical protein